MTRLPASRTTSVAPSNTGSAGHRARPLGRNSQSPPIGRQPGAASRYVGEDQSIPGHGFAEGQPANPSPARLVTVASGAHVGFDQVFPSHVRAAPSSAGHTSAQPRVRVMCRSPTPGRAQPGEIVDRTSPSGWWGWSRVGVTLVRLGRLSPRVERWNPGGRRRWRRNLPATGIDHGALS